MANKIETSSKNFKTRINLNHKANPINVPFRITPSLVMLGLSFGQKNEKFKLCSSLLLHVQFCYLICRIYSHVVKDVYYKYQILNNL